MTLASGQTIGQFRITSKLGAGGMGEVWLAEDTTLARDVALKLLPEDVASDPERRARFEREAKVLASLNHPNIATLFGLESVADADPESGGTTFLVMELVQGEDLSERIARGPVPADEAIAIALQIAEALEAAHAQGIVHRDLKPANIKLRSDGTVKVLDFGLAKAWDAEGGDNSLSMSPTLTAHATAAGVILGTAAYMAPEQAAGIAADQRADIWAFGVVLWEMLTGAKLFEGETVSHVLASVLKDEPELDALPGDLPPRIRGLIEHCLRKKPRRRLQAIGDARVLLEDYLAAPEEFAAAPAAAIPTRSRSIWWWALPLGLAVLAAVIFAATRSVRQAHQEPRVIRFDLAPPEGTSFHLDAASPGPIVISPDGKNVVFSARDSSGTVHLYKRAFDAAEATVMSGADGAQYPFWSSDSKSIGFFADGKLKKIDADGGPPLTLCDAPNGKGGSWNASGDIIFSPGPTDPILRVSQAGGEPEPVTELNLERGDNSHRHPRFLPDGRHFLFLARNDGSAGQSGHPVVVASLDGGPETVLIRSTAAAEFAAGRLLFMRDRTLMGRPFDTDSLEFTGDAVPVGQDVLVIPGAMVAIFSASSRGVLAYQPSAGGLGVVLTWFDRDGDVIGTVGESSEFKEVWVSPDGTMAAVSVEDVSAGSADIWILEIDRNVISRLTSDPGDEQQIVWSPDSRRVAFSRRGGGSANIYAKDIGGAGPAQLLLESEDNTFPTSWSPDGRLLGFDAESPDTGWDQWILPLDEGEPYPFLQSQFNEVNGVFSPDGRWMAFASDDSGRQEIYVTPFPGPGRRWRVSTEGGQYANWSSTGRELFFMSFSNQIMAVGLETGDNAITIAEPRTLINANVSPSSYPYSPAPEGEKILLIAQPIAPQSLRVVFDWTAELPES